MLKLRKLDVLGQVYQLPDYRVDSIRPKGDMSDTQALSRNCENLSFQCKRRTSNFNRARRRVRMWNTGADWSVVAMIEGNASGAKGPSFANWNFETTGNRRISK